MLLLCDGIQSPCRFMVEIYAPYAQVYFTCGNLITFCSCSTPEKSIQQPEKRGANQIAIEDFSEKCKLYEEDSIFDLLRAESLKGLYLIKSDSRGIK